MLLLIDPASAVLQEENNGCVVAIYGGIVEESVGDFFDAKGLAPFYRFRKFRIFCLIKLEGGN